MFIRVGEGHNMYWKNCRWYQYQKKPSKYNSNGIDEREDAIKDAIERGYINSIYISKGNRAYEKISIEELRKL